MTEFPR